MNNNTINSDRCIRVNVSITTIIIISMTIVINVIDTTIINIINGSWSVVEQPGALTMSAKHSNSTVANISLATARALLMGARISSGTSQAGTSEKSMSHLSWTIGSSPFSAPRAAFLMPVINLMSHSLVGSRTTMPIFWVLSVRLMVLVLSRAFMACMDGLMGTYVYLGVEKMKLQA